MACERCGVRTNPASYEIWDYCNECSKNLCSKCMSEGCCGKKPAVSGTREDDRDDED
jgi:hypothetical protein